MKMWKEQQKCFKSEINQTLLEATVIPLIYYDNKLTEVM